MAPAQHYTVVFHNILSVPQPAHPSTATPRENVSASSLMDSLGALMMSAAQRDKTMGGSFGGAQRQKSLAFPVYLFTRPCGEHLGFSAKGRKGKKRVDKWTRG